MRVPVAIKRKIRAGDRVRIFVKLPRSLEVSRVSVWVREREDLPFSPYVDPGTSEWLDRGKPVFNRPFHQRLHEQKRSHVFDFIAYADMDVQLNHEADDPKDKKPKVRIKRYGTVAQKFDGFRSYIGRASRRLAALVGIKRSSSPD